MPFTATVVMLTVTVIVCMSLMNACLKLIAAMRENDLLLITADHGNDPTYAGTDHTREYIAIVGL